MYTVVSKAFTVKTKLHIRMKKHQSHLDLDIQSTREYVWKVYVLQLRTYQA
jgi:hypothetical protein